MDILQSRLSKAPQPAQLIVSLVRVKGFSKGSETARKGPNSLKSEQLVNQFLVRDQNNSRAGKPSGEHVFGAISIKSFFPEANGLLLGAISIESFFL